VKYLIDNSDYNLKNVGDDCMLLVTINNIQLNDKSAEIYVFTDSVKGLYDICPSVKPLSIRGRLQWMSKWSVFGGLYKLVPQRYRERLYFWEIIFKARFHNLSVHWARKKAAKSGKNVSDMMEFLNVIHSVDYVVASGGGYINDSFSEHAERTLSTLLLAQSLGKKTVMFGQGIGPLRKKGLKDLAKRVFPNLKAIGLRESLFSPSVVTEMGCPDDRVVITGDDAIGIARNSTSRIIGNDIGINIRIAAYAAMSEQQLDIYKHILRKISKILNASYKPIPISSHLGEEDYDSIAKLIEINQTKNDLNSHQKVISNVSTCRVVVTGSYHAGVFALSQGIPVVALCKSTYYKQKFDGLRNQFKVGCVLIDMSSDDAENLMEKAILELWEMSDKLKPSLLLEADSQIRIGASLYKNLFYISTD
jgi:polysaccharide pyruvyl transferase WcaK-like protein